MLRIRGRTNCTSLIPLAAWPLLCSYYACLFFLEKETLRASEISGKHRFLTVTVMRRGKHIRRAIIQIILPVTFVPASDPAVPQTVDEEVAGD